MATVDIKRSIRYQLDEITDAQAAEYSRIIGVEPMTARELAAWWEDWSWDGLAQLLYVRMEPERVAEGGPGSGNFGHAGIPGQRGGSAPAGGGGLASELGVPVYDAEERIEEERAAVEAELGVADIEIQVVSGTELDGHMNEMERAAGGTILGIVTNKGQLLVRDEVPEGTVAHELIHASGLGLDKGNILVVEGLTQAYTEELFPGAYKTYPMQVDFVRNTLAPLTGTSVPELTKIVAKSPSAKDAQAVIGGLIEKRYGHLLDPDDWGAPSPRRTIRIGEDMLNTQRGHGPYLSFLIDEQKVLPGRTTDSHWALTPKE